MGHRTGGDDPIASRLELGSSNPISGIEFTPPSAQMAEKGWPCTGAEIGFLTNALTNVGRLNAWDICSFKML